MVILPVREWGGRGGEKRRGDRGKRLRGDSQATGSTHFAPLTTHGEQGKNVDYTRWV
jgi:hypothetical protein